MYKDKIDMFEYYEFIKNFMEEKQHEVINQSNNFSWSSKKTNTLNCTGCFLIRELSSKYLHVKGVLMHTIHIENLFYSTIVLRLKK